MTAYNGTLQNVIFRNGWRYKMVRGSKWYITKWQGYKTVHVTKRCTVTKLYVTKRYDIITVQYHNGLVKS